MEKKPIEITHELKGDTLVLRVVGVQHNKEFGMRVPKGLYNDLFKDVDQGVEIDLKLGTSPAEILKNDETLMSHLLSGFSAKFKATYVKNCPQYLDFVDEVDSHFKRRV